MDRRMGGEKNEKMKQNPAGENNRAPSALPKDERTVTGYRNSAGSPKPIPSTMGYVGKRIK